MKTISILTTVGILAVAVSANAAAPTFNLTAKASPASSTHGTPIKIVDTVTGVTSPLVNGIVDLEVYDAKGAKVTAFNHQGANIAINKPTPFTFTWTSAPKGVYTVKLGLFATGWKQTLAWNNGAAKFIVK